jgi:hypothetical protein
LKISMTGLFFFTPSNFFERSFSIVRWTMVGKKSWEHFRDLSDQSRGNKYISNLLGILISVYPKTSKNAEAWELRKTYMEISSDFHWLAMETLRTLTRTSRIWIIYREQITLVSRFLVPSLRNLRNMSRKHWNFLDKLLMPVAPSQAYCTLFPLLLVVAFSHFFRTIVIVLLYHRGSWSFTSTFNTIEPPA